jgi:hypothetical protein
MYPGKSRLIYSCIQETVIQPALLVISETWTLKLYGRYMALYVWYTWGTRYNMELETLYNRPDIVADIKSRRAECLGYVLKMQCRRVPQKNPGWQR